MYDVDKAPGNENQDRQHGPRDPRTAMKMNPGIVAAVRMDKLIAHQLFSAVDGKVFTPS